MSERARLGKWEMRYLRTRAKVLGAVAAVVLLVLGGCSTVPSEILVPVPVKCLTPTPNVPTYRFSPPYTDIFQATRDLLGDREVSLAYEEELRVSLETCK